MELKIDGTNCDLGLTPCTVPGYDAVKTVDINACREGRVMNITIPRTLRNDAAMGFACDPYCGPKFNTILHKAEVSTHGAVLLAGTVRLLKAAADGYRLEIRDGGARWASNAALRMFNTLGVDYDAALTPATILASWTNASPVKFFPICRDEYPQLNSSEDLLTAERFLSVDDYHPFLHIATLVEQIFSEAGYHIESQFLSSEFFRSLYMSGAYSTRDTTAAAAHMGFFARRLAAAAVVGDGLGRVYANPAVTTNSVGNIVDTATPQTFDADKEPIPELFNNGGCFSLDGNKIRFTPPTEMSVGFEYYLKYTTGHRILSRTRLKGFDSVYLGPGADMSFALANRYVDRRAEVTPNRTYLLVIFNFGGGEKFRIGYGVGGVMIATWASVTTRTASVTTPGSAATGTVPLLQIYSNGSWVTYAGDWALYDGYIAETGQTTVELRVRTPAQKLTPTAPKFFNQIYFSGAEPGMTFKIHKQSSLQPRFVSSPGYGSSIRFADVAQHRVRQSVLLEALGHLFNLRFYTEQTTKTVYIEPADEFLGAGVEADWRSKSDFLQPVVLSDIAQEVAETRTWGYRTGDGAVARFNTEAVSPLGEWTAETDSFAAKQGEAKLTNPLFQPTISVKGRYSNAPSARIMQVGDRDNAEQDGEAFAPRIVRYAGMKTLPAGERWGYPSHGSSYPLVAFHLPGEGATPGFTLGFEDRDGAEGLHRFYDRQVAQESSCERVDLSLRLAPHEIENLLVPGTGMPDLRSIFRLDIGGEQVRATLQAIAEYHSDDGSVRCTFSRMPEL